jgi:hypothetical protein
MSMDPQTPERDSGDQPSGVGQSSVGQTASRRAEPLPADNPMGLLVSGILLLGGISALIGWGLGHAYPPL